MTQRPRCGDKPMFEACAPVRVRRGEEFYIGATRATNNSAEMQGDIEAIFWLNSCVEHGILNLEDDVLSTVDSLYVKGLIDDKFLARENRVFAMLLGHVWKVTERGYDCTSTGYVVTRVTWRMALQIAWQTRVLVGSFSVNGGDGAR